MSSISQKSLDHTQPTKHPEIFRWTLTCLWKDAGARQKLDLVAAVVLLLVAKAFSIVFFVSIKSFADSSVESGSVEAGTAFRFGLLLAGCKLAEAGTSALRESLLVSSMLTTIRKQLLTAHAAALAWPIARHLSEDGKTLSIVLVRGARELYMYYHLVLQQLSPLLLDVLIACSIIAYVMSWKEGVLIFVAMSFYAWASRRLIEWRLPLRRRLEKADINREVVAKDTYNNIQVVKAFGRYDDELSRFDEALAEYVTAGCRSQHSLGKVLTAQALMFALTLVAVFLVSYYSNSARLTAGAVILSVTMLYQLFIPLNGLGTMYRELRNAEVNLQPLMALVAEHKEDLPAGAVQTPGASGLACDNLHAVAGGRTIIHGISVQIPAGTTLAVVGPSGSGKSTFLKCLAGLHEYSCGSLKVGDSIATATTDGRFPAVLYVPQDASIFARDLAANLLISDSSDGHAEAQSILKSLSIAEVVMRSKPDSREFGHTFAMTSGGERQRLSIARGLLQRTGIVIFDEPTSSLDPSGESAAFRAILSAPMTTTIVSTHSVNFLDRFDQVLFLIDGHQAGLDSHYNLLRNNAEYAAFVATEGTAEAG